VSTASSRPAITGTWIVVQKMIITANEHNILYSLLDTFVRVLHDQDEGHVRICCRLNKKIIL
jgi:hypothetical protein